MLDYSVDNAKKEVVQLFPQDNLLDYFKASKLVQNQINPYFKLNHA